MTRRLKTILALLMAMMMICGGAFADALPTDTPAPTDAQSTVEDGTVRVLLTYPGTGLTEIDITLNGSYSINANSGFRFERGSKLHVFVSDGEPVLTYQGMTMHMGAGFMLTRHQTTGENGLRIGSVSGLYEGDLNVTVVDGELRMVLSIFIEDYLKGVVPYEMSDSFPIEALKAQAVAARTYALRRRNASRDYDVYDNTSDQVFRGYESQYTNAAAAVSATAGLVGTYNGNLSECFYSASNGGQTDLYKNAFGEENANYDYLDMRIDPYDLHNPQSRVKTAAIYKQPGTGTELPEGLDALIKAALGEQLAALGYDDSAENITVVDVLYAKPHTPKYDVPSRVMTKLRLKVRVMARPVLETPTADPAVTPNPAATEQPGITLGDMKLLGNEFTVDLDIFDDVEDALGLSINRADNEIITVSEQSDRFIIESRRFGHGLGMSQRGAEYMAGQYSWDYNQILTFYYPGMEFVTREYAPSILPAIVEEAAATPRPTAEPTPRPTYIPVGDLPDGAFYAEVALGSDASTLNLRAEPSITSQILYALQNGQPLIVINELGDGWVEVSVGTLKGYVAAQYLRLI